MQLSWVDLLLDFVLVAAVLPALKVNDDDELLLFAGAADPKANDGAAVAALLLLFAVTVFGWLAEPNEKDGAALLSFEFGWFEGKVEAVVGFAADPKENDGVAVGWKLKLTAAFDDEFLPLLADLKANDRAAVTALLSLLAVPRACFIMNLALRVKLEVSLLHEALLLFQVVILVRLYGTHFSMRETNIKCS